MISVVMENKILNVVSLSYFLKKEFSRVKMKSTKICHLIYSPLVIR